MDLARRRPGARLFLPDVVWQSATASRRSRTCATSAHRQERRASPLGFVVQQILIIHPALLPVWLAGLACCSGAGGPFPRLGWTWLVFFALLFVTPGQELLPRPGLPDALRRRRRRVREGFERWPVTAWPLWPRPQPRRHRRGRSDHRAAGAAVLVPRALIAYEQALGFAPPKTEVAHHGPLPQMFGDQFGWPELVAEVARIYQALPPEERARARSSPATTARPAQSTSSAHARAAAGCQRPPDAFLLGAAGRAGDVLHRAAGRPREPRGGVRVGRGGRGHHHPWGMAEENSPI